jgi:hypothetical protein
MALTSRGLLRLFLFLGGYVIFLLLGASLFSAIESPEELQKVQNLRKLRSEFLKNHPSVTGKLFSMELIKMCAHHRPCLSNTEKIIARFGNIHSPNKIMILTIFIEERR